MQRTVWQQTTARAREVQRRLFLPRTGVVMLLLLLWTCRHVNSNRSNPKYGRYYCPTLLLPCVCFTIQRFSLSCLPSHYILSRSSSCSAKWTSSPSSRTVRYHLYLRYGNVQSPQPISDPDGVAIGAGCRLHTLSIYVVLVIGSVVEVLCSYLIAPMPTPTPFARICPDKEPGWPVAVDSGLRWWSQQSGDSSDRLIAVMLHLAGLLAHAHHHVLLGRPLPVNQVRKLSRRMHGWRHVPPPWSP